jgi:3-hydroxyacyl-[acyl-carrier-protein] dehydratase
MKFELIDRIVDLTPRERIVTIKAVSLAEEYLADHFPTFPVLPGVLMLQAMVESAAWLVRDAEEFSSSVILLKSARNVTYKSFVRPGDALTLTVKCRRLGNGESEFEGIGHCRQDEMVRARFGLEHFCLKDRMATGDEVDRRLTDQARSRFALLRGAGERNNKTG